MCNVSSIFSQSHFLPISSNSEIAKAYYYEAHRKCEHSDTEAFLELLDKAVQEDPNIILAYAFQLFAKISFQQQDEAKELISRALDIPQEGLTLAEKIVRKMIVLLEKNLEANTEPIMQELVKAYPKTRQAHEMAGLNAYWLIKDKAAALKYFQQMVKVEPSYAGGYNLLGYLYLDAAQFKKAKKAFETYQKLAPNEANPCDSLGDFYMEVKDYQKAASYYDKAVQLGMEDSKERADRARKLASQ